MQSRKFLWILATSLGAVVVGSALGGWIGGFSDATWWQVLPWFLLAFFWVGIIMALRRKRRRGGI